MNNANYAADKIFNHLIKNGWVSTECFSAEQLKFEIEQIIINSTTSNVPIYPNIGIETTDSATTYTYAT